MKIIKTRRFFINYILSIRAGSYWLVLVYFLLTALNSYAQSSQAYLIPRQIYVGDPAVLVVPLPAAIENSEDIILTKDKFFSDEFYFPADAGIDFQKIILERRVSGSRLVIEFTAFVPGDLELPAISIGGEYFTNLRITVNSTIGGAADRFLSGAESQLAMPGTALMLYGSISALVFLILLTIWFFVKGRALLEKIKEKWKRYRLFVVMRNTEKRLQKAVTKGADKRIILDKLSWETRNFLSILTGDNCRAMTAGEFEKLPVHNRAREEGFSLGNFFQSCDEYRFSGADIESDNIQVLFNDLKKFIDIMENLYSNKAEEKPA